MRKYTLISFVLLIFVSGACSVMKKTQSSLAGTWTFVDVKIKKASDETTKESSDITKELIKDSYMKFLDEKNVEMKISSDKTLGKWSVSNDGKKINIVTKNGKEAETFDIIELTSEKLVLSYSAKNSVDGTIVVMSFKR